MDMIWMFAYVKHYDLYDVLRHVPDDGLEFTEWLERTLNALDTPRSLVVSRSHLERTYAYHIIAGRRQPSRDKFIQLAVGMGLDIETTSELLERAGFAGLRPYKKRDAALAYGIARKMSVPQIDEMLFLAGIEPLRAGYPDFA